MTKLYQRTERVERSVATGTSDGTSTLRMPLNKDDLTSEYILGVTMTQVCTVAPTANASFVPMIESILLETDRGQLVIGDGESIAELSAFTEKQSSERVALGLATVATVYIDLHLELDGALRDLMGAIETKNLSKCDLVVKFATDVSGLLTGETIAAGVKPSYVVDVQAVTYPDMTGLGEFDSVMDENGDELPNQYAGIATVNHRQAVMSISGTQKGELQPIRLQGAGSLLRFIQLLTTDDATNARNDNVVEKIRVVAANVEKRSVKFHDVQASNERKREVVRIGSGVAVLDFGDDEEGYLNLDGINEALLHLTISQNAPANWKIRIAEAMISEQG